MKDFKIKNRFISSVLLLSAAVGLSVFTGGCKPTEKGYKAAYDAALNKREKTQADYDSTVAVGIVQQADGPLLKRVNGEDVYLLSEIIKPLDETPAEKLTYNVAVGCFKMPTNCLALVNDLRQEGIDAFGAKSGEDKFYVIAGTFDELGKAVEFDVDYKNNQKRAYVGLPDAPIIILSDK